MLKMTIDNEEVVSDKDITINEEMLSASSAILNNVYPKEWEEDKDYTSRFYYPQDYSKALIQRSYVTQEAEAGTTIQVNGSVTLTDVDTTKNSRVLRLLGQTSQTGTPTPSSPIPVNVVSGDNEIQVCGKNLYNNELSSSVKQRNCTATCTNGEIVVNATGTDCYYGEITNAGGSWDITKGQLIKVSPNTQYFFNVSNTNFTKNFISYYDKNKLSVSATGIGRNNTFTTGNNVEFVSFRVGYGNSVSGTTYKLNVMLNKGNTASPYEPYQGNTYNIDLPVENLFEGVFEEGGWDIGNGQKQYAPGRNRCPDLIAVKPSTTYTISFENTGTCYVLEYGSNSNYLTYSQIFYHVYNGSFTTNANTRYITFYYIPYNHDFTLNEKCQLEKGSKANSYTPFGTTPIELCKIGNYQDYFYKDSDKWYLHKEIGKVVFTGGNDETWNISETSTSGSNRFLNGSIANLVTKPSADSITINTLSNYFIAKSANQTYSNQEGLDISRNGNVHIYADSTKTYTVEQFKTWLSTHNTVVYYPLSTPTNTEITDTTLISQLNALSSQ